MRRGKCHLLPPHRPSTDPAAFRTVKPNNSLLETIIYHVGYLPYRQPNNELLPSIPWKKIKAFLNSGMYSPREANVEICWCWNINNMVGVKSQGNISYSGALDAKLGASLDVRSQRCKPTALFSYREKATFIISGVSFYRHAQNGETACR